MIVSITLTGDQALLARMGRFPQTIKLALERKVKILALKLENRVKTKKLDGQVLNRVTGALSRSISHVVLVTATAVMGRVFSSGDVKYAAIHEYGGTIHHPGGTAYITSPKAAHLMMFVSNANATADMPRTKPHDIVMPERSFMRSSLRDMSVEISRGMKQEVVKTLQRTVRGQ